MQIFESTIVVSDADLDELQHVNNVQYVHWVMDIAKAHWLKNASNDILENYFWVLLSHNIDYKSQAVLNDTILIKTYVTKAEGATSTRKVDMYLKDSMKLIASSETNWCLMNTKTNRPARISDELANLFN